jgi:hypothetical protein
MFDQMSMPVLFTVLIVTLAVVSAGVFIAVRVLGARAGASDPVVNAPGPEIFRRAPYPQAATRKAVGSDQAASASEWIEEGKV